MIKKELILYLANIKYYPMKNKLIKLFEDYFKQTVSEIKLLPQSGSYRKYYRMKSKDYSIIESTLKSLQEAVHNRQSAKP